ncbi:response regulator transcription factor [Eisenbergiella sp.]
MYKVLLVDDEPYVLEGLREFIDWQKYGFVICAEASDGPQALEMIYKYYPDLVITDIQMPMMDGLNFIAGAEKGTGHSIKYIILSGYERFDYIKKAISLDVEAYLLKPVEPQELENQLVRIKDILDTEKKYLCAELNQYVVLRRSFEAMCHGRTKMESVSDESWPGNEFALWNSFYLVLLKLYIPEEAEGTEEEICSELLQAFNRTEGKEKVKVLLHDEKGRAWLFLPGEKDIVPEKTLKNMQILLERKNGWFLGGVISGSFSSPARMRECYDDVLAKIDIAFYDEKNAIYKAEEKAAAEYQYRIDSQKTEKMNCQGDFISLCSYFKEERIAPGIVRSSVLRLIEEMGGPLERISRRIWQWNFADIRRELLVNCGLGFKKEKISDKTPEGIERVLEYIRKNYKKNLKLQELSEQFFFNTNYLGRVLNRETGMPLSSYLHFLRIMEAKRLLAENELKISEIAFELGYKDTEYFTGKFKEFENMTPSAFRRRCLDS